MAMQVVESLLRRWLLSKSPRLQPAAQLEMPGWRGHTGIYLGVTGAESKTDCSRYPLLCSSAYLGPVVLVLRMFPAVATGQKLGSVLIARAGPPQVSREGQAMSFLLSRYLHNIFGFAGWPARPKIFTILPFTEVC